MLAAAALPFARFDDSPLNLRDPESESVSTLFDLLQDDRFNPFRAAVLANNAAEAEEIAAKLRGLPEVKRVETVRDLVPDHQDEKLAMLGDLALMLTPVLSPGDRRPPPTPQELRAAIADLRAAAMAEAARSPGARRLAESLGVSRPPMRTLRGSRQRCSSTCRRCLPNWPTASTPTK